MRPPFRALIQGATGAVGSELVRQCLADERFDRVLAVARRPLDIEHARLDVQVLTDFLDLAPLAPRLPEVNVLFSALGVSQMQEKDPARYRLITHDYVLALAKASNDANPDVHMVFVSGGGADPSGKSRVLFARVKGETERDLRELLGPRLWVVRPGLIRPTHPRENAIWFERAMMPIASVLAPVARGLTSSTIEVAQAMMQLVIDDAPAAEPHLLENRAIRDAADRFRAAPRH